MRRCASCELIEAMKGHPAPWLTNETGHREDYLFACACGCSRDCDDKPAYIGFPVEDSMVQRVRLVEDAAPVTCPACLALMRLATDPVRWDWLEERGLVRAA